MSGGSFNYIYGKLDEAISEMDRLAKSPLHRAFLQHLKLVSEALHDVEWFYSGDYSEEQADETIRKVLEHSAKGATMEVIKQDLLEILGQIKKELA